MALCLLAMASARAQDAVPSNTVTVRPRFDIVSLYKPSAGFGLGGGVDVRNLWRPGSRLSADVYVAQHAGEYEIAFFPVDVFREGVAGGVSARYETVGRMPFYGLGPRSTKNNRLRVEVEAMSAAGHVGVRRGALGVLASAGYQTGVVGSFADDIDNAFSRLDARSTARITRDVGVRVSGATLGATAYLDRRDHHEMPRRGTLLAAGAEGFLDLESTGYDFVRFQARAATYLPAGAFTFVGRALALHTVPLGNDLPLVLLPRLSHHVTVGPESGRFTGNDLLALDVQVRHPIPNLHPTMATDGFLILSVFNVYDNLFTDVRLPPSWAEKFDPAERYPLRVAVGAGIRAFVPETRNVVFTAAVGLSADGLATSSITLNLDPRRLHLPWRW